MHRVVVRRFDHRGKLIVETGPWHVDRGDAENWAAILRYLGYDARVESMHGRILREVGPDGGGAPEK